MRRKQKRNIVVVVSIVFAQRLDRELADARTSHHSWRAWAILFLFKKVIRGFFLFFRWMISYFPKGIQQGSVCWPTQRCSCVEYISAFVVVVRMLCAAQCKLAKTGEFFKERAEMHIMNPKAVTMGELYGEFDPNTHDFIDGAMARSVAFPFVQTCCGEW